MSTPAHCQTFIPRDGSGQRQRFLKTLDPAYAPIDDRSLEDLLVFARRYAERVRFFDSDQTPPPAPDQAQQSKGKKNLPSPPPADTEDNWLLFFEKDMAVIAASVVTTDLPKRQKSYADARAQLFEKTTTDHLEELVKPILLIAEQLDQWYSLAIPENPLHQDLKLAIVSSLSIQLRKLISYAKGFMLLNKGTELKLDYTLQNHDLWHDQQPPVPLDDSIYVGTDFESKIRYAALYIDDIFQAFFKVLSETVQKADDYLAFALEKYPKHQPHMALFIAFLELFQLAQNQLNTLTERHLNFYYRDVLHLHEKPARPDHLHLIFELAKNVSLYNLKKGTPLTAGKDARNQEILYKTDTELVINKAVVQELKTVFLDKQITETTDANGQLKRTERIARMYASPVANSADGKGEKFTEPESKWPTFGGPLADKNGVMNTTKIGFAIASPQLVLNSGNRKIDLAIQGLRRWGTGESFEIRLTGEKGWVTVPFSLKQTYDKVYQNARFTDDFETGFYLDGDRLTIFLPIKEQPIVAYNAKVHGDTAYPTSFPILAITLSEFAFQPPLDMDDFILGGPIAIQVQVGSFAANANDTNVYTDGLKKLVLQNGNGIVNPDAPLDPFTIYAAAGMPFYIGSEEIFNKPVNKDHIEVFLEPVNSSTFFATYRTAVLKDKQWKNQHNEQTDFLDRDKLITVTHWTNAAEKGFVRLMLNQPAGGGEFPDNSIPALLERAVANKVQTVSVSYLSLLENLNPAIDQFFHIYPFGVAEIYYWELSREEVLRLVQQILAILKKASDLLQQKPNLTKAEWTQQIEPEFTAFFGERGKTLSENLWQLTRQYPIDQAFPLFLPQMEEALIPLLNASEQDRLKDEFLKLKALKNNLLVSSLSLIPQFRFGTYVQGLSLETNPNQYNTKIQQQGNLYIGIANLTPPQNLSVLFQMAEGSEAYKNQNDENLDPPVVHWSYLSNNQWIPLSPERILSDSTYGLQATGIILFDIPEEATTNNTLITTGLHWLAASVDENTHLLPQTIQVVAQATIATFADQQNDPAHYLNPLPALSVSKLQTKVPEIAKVTQPFASFGAEPAENGIAFYTQTSERLRHKGRAINVWDYEHLVLEEFPTIYKVKAIGYTDPRCLCRDVSVRQNNEVQEICCGPQVAPGHVLVVPISNLRNRNAVNILQPRTGRRVMREMEAFLQKRTSPFVKVRVRNPLYEEIKVSFKVKFYTGIDKGYYLTQLNDALVRYLTPWAFDEQAEVVFGGTVYASAIINFIEEQTYVHFITDFTMQHLVQECCQDTKTTLPDVVEIRPTTARSILVSALQHDISLYEDPKELTPCEEKKAQLKEKQKEELRIPNTDMKTTLKTELNTILKEMRAVPQPSKPPPATKKKPRRGG